MTAVDALAEMTRRQEAAGPADIAVANAEWCRAHNAFMRPCAVRV